MSSILLLRARSHRRMIRRLFDLLGNTCPACHRSIQVHNDRHLDACAMALDYAPRGTFAAHLKSPAATRGSKDTQ